MATHYCTTYPCPTCLAAAQLGRPSWTAPVWVINRPCGHSHATNCGCSYGGQMTTTTNIEVFGEYVGKHRKPEE